MSSVFRRIKYEIRYELALLYTDEHYLTHRWPQRPRILRRG
jgi:hypothetical protein